MLKKYLAGLGVVFGLLAISAAPALANHIDTATSTMTCSSYSLYVSASDLVPGETYTISYEIDVTPAATGFPITGSIPLTGPPGGTFSDTVTGSFPTLSGSYTFSGTASLVGYNTIPITVSPTSLTCAPPPPPPCSAQSTNPSNFNGTLWA